MSVTTDPTPSTRPAAPGATALPAVAAEREWEPRVLVVDDDPVCRVATKGLLERLGVAVDVAADGSEAVRLATGWPYAAIFMDCWMPEVDGFEATREIRLPEGLSRSALVIAVTSRTREVCLASGMDHHIAKPLRFDVLQEVCATLGLIAIVPVAPAAAVSPSALEATPVLVTPAGLTTAHAAELGAAVVRRGLIVLPELWRALNRLEAGTAERAARALEEAAQQAGAARLAAECDGLAATLGPSQAMDGAGREWRLRRALRETAVALAPENSEPVAAAGPTTIRVVIADDDPFARMAIEAMLKGDEGIELIGSAADVDEALGLVAESDPDVAVLDHMMPGGGGPEAARRIREGFPRTRVIGLTASDSQGAYLSMLRAGAAGLLIKGSSPQKLSAMIRRAADQAS